jgi:class 3 adenylate cyclase
MEMKRAASHKTAETIRREIKSLLFADVTNYSWIEDRSLPGFQSVFLQTVRNLMDAVPGADVLYANTWGDGLFMVFARPASTARFAVELVARMESIDWTSLALNADKTVRIALHAGPVYRAVDPITERMSYFGGQVSLAGRVEPITPPGCVFATEAFVSRLVLDPNQSFRGDYVGIMDLPKNRGRVPLYQINTE